MSPSRRAVRRPIRSGVFENRTASRNLEKHRESPDGGRFRSYGVKCRRRVFLSVRRGRLNRGRPCVNGMNGGVSRRRLIAPFPLNREERRHRRPCGGRFRGGDIGNAGGGSGRGFGIGCFGWNSRHSAARSSSFRSGDFAGRHSASPDSRNRAGNIFRHPSRPSESRVRHARTVRPADRMTREGRSAFGVREIAIRNPERRNSRIGSLLKNRQSHGKTLIRRS